MVNDVADIDGAFDFTGFDLGDVERIEVLSGPQSSLWGSSAIGGVIAFTTRELDGVRAEAEAGSYDTIRARLAGGVANDRFALGAFVSHFDTSGISAADEADGNTEADGATITTVGANARYSFGPAVTVEGRVRYNETDADIDGFPAPTYALADTDDSISREQLSGFARLTVQALGLEHQFSVSASDLTRRTFSAFPAVFEADRQAYRWQASGDSAEGRVTYAFGAEHEESSGALSSGATEDLSTSSLFATARIDLSERFSVTGGMRHDDTDDFGDATTGRLSAAYEPGGGFILSGAWGTGFKAPTDQPGGVRLLLVVASPTRTCAPSTPTAMRRLWAGVRRTGGSKAASRSIAWRSRTRSSGSTPPAATASTPMWTRPARTVWSWKDAWSCRPGSIWLWPTPGPTPST